MNELKEQIAKRRTFAIISHPDAGKTTLTEKLLVYSGMLHTAGMVRGRKGRRSVTSDWMSMEQERGISITASAMQITYGDVVLNLLDTPGHEDFSEDTYRTLTAADCAVMVIDAAKGVEKQTRKLFEVCRMRGIPILTVINKMDMPGRDPLELMDEVENVLGIHSFAYNWPIGSAKQFCGVYDRFKEKCLLFTKTSTGGDKKALLEEFALDDAEVAARAGADEVEKVKSELELLNMAGNSYSMEEFRKGLVTPVFFASALSNFGVEPFFESLIKLAPEPRSRIAMGAGGNEYLVDPEKTPFSAYVFKIQSNMNKQHRDSMAFLRICSGKFEKDMTVWHHRLKREIRLSHPHSMFSGQRETLAEAYAGDVIGVINPGVFFIGDTISISKEFNFKPLPQFQPEIFAKVSPKDVGKRKSFDKGIEQLAAEGTIQILWPYDYAGDIIFGAVGRLQYEVMQHRLLEEYKVDTLITPLSYQCSAWIVGDMNTFKKTSQSLLAKDAQQRPMALFSSQWEKEYSMKQNPNHKFLDLKVD